MRWEPDMIARAAALWKEGLSYTQIADEFGCTRGSISGITNRHPDKFPLRKILQRVRTRKEERSSAAPTLRRAVKAGTAIPPAVPADVSSASRAAGAPAGRAGVPDARSGSRAAPETVSNLPATLPITYLEAVFSDRCLHFAGDPLGRDGPDMPVCGAARADGVLNTRYCRRHLVSQYRVRDAA